MRRWVQKLIDQFDFDWNTDSNTDSPPIDISEERATLLFMIDSYNKNLFEVDQFPVRKVREILDEFAKEIVDPTKDNSERLLFRFRQFFSSYRIAEYTYIQKTFDDFRGIIWDFVDQLSEDLAHEQVEDAQIQYSLDELKEAVEANSIDILKNQSRQFIDSYIEFQSKKEVRRSQRLQHFKKSLKIVKTKLVEANENMLRDHLTSAFNRKCFDEHLKKQWQMYQISHTPVSLISLDIDHFKKINDNYGHAMGDHILIECVKLLQEVFNKETDFVARVGGEEFCIILSEQNIQQAQFRAEKAQQKIRSEVFVKDDIKVNFTVSMGIAELLPQEPSEDWMKRADTALYQSKTSGRNRWTLANAA